jgi:hypothetical protein
MAYSDKGHRELLRVRDFLVKEGHLPASALAMRNPDPTGRGSFEPTPAFTDQVFCTCHGELVGWAETHDNVTVRQWQRCATGRPVPGTVRQGRNGKGTVICRP